LATAEKEEALAAAEQETAAAIAETEKIVAAKIAAREKAEAREKTSGSAALKARKGTFFSPWPHVWKIQRLGKHDKQEDLPDITGAFKAVCRVPEYFKRVPEYETIVEQSQSGSQKDDCNGSDKKEKAKQKKKRQKNKLAHFSIPSSASMSSKSGDSDRSGNSKKKNTTSQQNFDHSSSGTSTRTGNSESSMCQSYHQYPDFCGLFPSTKAHMIPNNESSNCFKYYNVVCQAVLGFYSEDGAKLERIAKEMAEVKYNFLRARITNHEICYDNKPCWILVPACSLQEVLDWEPTKAYPVLAVANRAPGVEVEEAYRRLCPDPYTGEKFDVEAGVLKRWKCTRPAFHEATENLRQMTLAMAETLVGEGFEVKPDETLRPQNPTPAKEDCSNIIKKLQSKDKAQFEETRKSLNEDGIKLPQAMPEIGDLDDYELLLFEVDPSAKLDVYPDPMLLLIKAAINWSWFCGQKLLPTYCGSANEEDEGEEGEESDVEEEESPPIPTTIEFKL